MVNKPCCIDIYHGNNVNDNPTALAGLDQAKKTGIFALIHKASEGPGSRDQRYDARRAKWMTGGPIVVTDTNGDRLSLSPLFGAYHFFHGLDPVAEAKNFLMTARLKAGDMPFLDWEQVGASGYQPSIDAADAFCKAVEDSLGRVCGIYGGNVPRERFQAGKASSELLERFSRRPFWFCAYSGVKALSLLPEPWKAGGCFLWQDDGDQYGPGPHTIPGLDGYCDNSTVVDPMTFGQLHDQWLTLTGAAPVPDAITMAPEHHPVLSLADFAEKLQHIESEITELRQEVEK